MWQLAQWPCYALVPCWILLVLSRHLSVLCRCAKQCAWCTPTIEFGGGPLHDSSWLIFHLIWWLLNGYVSDSWLLCSPLVWFCWCRIASLLSIWVQKGSASLWSTNHSAQAPIAGQWQQDRLVWYEQYCKEKERAKSGSHSTGIQRAIGNYARYTAASYQYVQSDRCTAMQHDASTYTSVPCPSVHISVLCVRNLLSTLVSTRVAFAARSFRNFECFAKIAMKSAASQRQLHAPTVVQSGAWSSHKSAMPMPTSHTTVCQICTPPARNPHEMLRLQWSLHVCIHRFVCFPRCPIIYRQMYTHTLTYI